MQCRALAFLLAVNAAGCEFESSEVSDARDDVVVAARDATLAIDGRDIVARYHCADCHGSGRPSDVPLSGRTEAIPGTHAYGPNLTPDPETGLGAWSDAEIVAAVRTGVDREGSQLCVMPAFASLGDIEATSLVAYLRALPAIHRAVPESRCSVSDDPPDVTDRPPIDAALADDAPTDGAGATTDAGAQGTPDVASCPLEVVINEIQVGGDGGAADEFVEIFNPAGCDVALEGVSLRYVSATGAMPTTRWTASDSAWISAHGFAVVGGAGYAAGPVVGRLSGSAGTLSGTAGGLALTDRTGSTLDSLGYGSTATNAFVRGQPADTPAAGSSIARHPDGWDTGNNHADFTASAPTPGAPN